MKPTPKPDVALYECKRCHFPYVSVEALPQCPRCQPVDEDEETRRLQRALLQSLGGVNEGGEWLH